MNFNFQLFFLNPITILVIIVFIDLLFGDPVYSFHPIRIIGKFNFYYENKLREFGLYGKLGGILLPFFILTSVFIIFIFVKTVLLLFHWSLLWLWYIYLGWSLVALKDLLFHSKKVAVALEKRNLKESRRLVSMLVGRETKKMSFKACGRAAVESVSENLNDGVIAPLLFFCIFGIEGMIFYKVFNTLDSMIGYKNEKYLDFGWFSAKIDDLLSWIPARVSWILLSLTAGLLPGFSGKDAFKIGLRDFSKMSSPNAGWCEATAAGALKIKLCGPIWREGELAQDFWLGNFNDREGASFGDIYRMNKLALFSSFLGILLFAIILLLF